MRAFLGDMKGAERTQEALLAKLKQALAKGAKLSILRGPRNSETMSQTDSLNALRLNPKDTGSADVQIAILTTRINQLSEHLKSHVKDHSSRRGLLMLVSRRRRLLDYLKRTANERYSNVVKTLGLRK